MEERALATSYQCLTNYVDSTSRYPSESPSLIVVGHASWEPGILGLIAGRINDSYYRPAIAVQIGTKVSRASARSIPEFDIISAMETCAPLFTKYGGHARAAGFTIATERMRELVARLREIADIDADGHPGFTARGNDLSCEAGVESGNGFLHWSVNYAFATPPTDSCSVVEDLARATVQNAK